MTRARSSLISLSDTPWYHVVNRCVRRAFLCGDDHLTGQNYDHRRGWIVERVKQLASVFAIDVAAYAVMSNHYHLVLRVDAERAQGWSRDEVLRRWTQLFDGPVLVQQLQAAQERGEDAGMDAATLARIDEWAETYRARLMDISWFMRVLNETIARQANAEDKVTGRFWEGRFKSQALLDEQAVLTAMAYVDLNPIRAKMAETPEDSGHTSVAERMADLSPAGKAPARRARPSLVSENAAQKPVDREEAVFNEGKPSVTSLLTLRREAHLAPLPLQPLLPFDATNRLKAAIPFAFEDYLDLVETTGRSLHLGKRGLIGERVPALLQRLNIEPERFIECAAGMMRCFGTAIGAPAHLTELCAQRQVKYLRGIQAARRAFEDKTA